MCTVGIMAHNEAATIGETLESVLAQRVASADVRAVVVVSSGSTDATEALVREVARREHRVHLLTQPAREGKISADNLFFARFPAELHALCNADVILAPGALERLLAPLREPAVGMTGARVVPRVRPLDTAGFFDFANRLLWAVHHRVELRVPKMGEAVAFRRLVPRIPEEAIADEAYLEAQTVAAGLAVRYLPEAVAWAGCPTTLRDYFAVRRRNFCAHLRIERLANHRVATRSAGLLARATLEALGEGLAARWAAAFPQRLRLLRPLARWTLWLGPVIALEVTARIAGRIDAARNPEVHRRWHMAVSARRDAVLRARSASRRCEPLP